MWKVLVSLKLLILMEGLTDEPDYLSESSALVDLGYCDELTTGEQWLVSLNVRSIVANKFKLEDSLLKQEPKIVALQEVWQANSANLKFENYSFESETRVGRKGGGVGILIDKSVSYSRPKDLCLISDVCEAIAINTDTFTIMSVYIPPGAIIQNVIKELEKLLTRCTQKPIFLCGDFNIDFSKDNYRTNKFNDLMMSFELVPTISKPTRITPSCSSLIDNIFTNRKLNMKCGILNCDISDHLAPFISIETEQASKITQDSKPKRSTGPKNLNYFRMLLKNIQWKIYENDPEGSFCNFQNQLLGVFHESCPLVKHRTKSNNKCNPWMSSGLLKSRAHKQKLLKKFHQTPTEANHNKWKEYSKMYFKLIKSAKAKYWHNYFESNEGNSRQIWKGTKRL